MIRAHCMFSSRCEAPKKIVNRLSCPSLIMLIEFLFFEIFYMAKRKIFILWIFAYFTKNVYQSTKHTVALKNKANVTKIEFKFYHWMDLNTWKQDDNNTQVSKNRVFSITKHTREAKKSAFNYSLACELCITKCHQNITLHSYRSRVTNHTTLIATLLYRKRISPSWLLIRQATL